MQQSDDRPPFAQRPSLISEQPSTAADRGILSQLEAGGAGKPAKRRPPSPGLWMGGAVAGLLVVGAGAWVWYAAGAEPDRVIAAVQAADRGASLAPKNVPAATEPSVDAVLSPVAATPRPAKEPVPPQLAGAALTPTAEVTATAASASSGPAPADEEVSAATILEEPAEAAAPAPKPAPTAPDSLAAAGPAPAHPVAAEPAHPAMHHAVQHQAVQHRAVQHQVVQHELVQHQVVQHQVVQHHEAARVASASAKEKSKPGHAPKPVDHDAALLAALLTHAAANPAPAAKVVAEAKAGDVKK